MIINQGEEIDNKNFTSNFEKSFGIKDEAFILQILRTNTYSDPIGSICREVVSNCRDSHREAGKADIPVEVELSEDELTNSKKSLVFRDFGIGLSPERINEVYTVYGESTKRSSNEFTGGFGLGAKTPFAYTDSFSVNTIFNGVKYSYQLVIDKSEKGKIIEVNRQLTSESNQTEVVIPIEDKDIRVFTEKLLYAISFWDVKPKFIGFENIGYGVVEKHFKKLTENEILYENKFGKLIQDQTNNLPQISVLVDKIIYPLNLDSLTRTKFLGLDRSLYKTLVFEFGNGELDLSVSREQLYYSKRTKTIIQRRLDNFINTIKQEFKNDISILKNDREKLAWRKEVYLNKWESVKNNISKVSNEIYQFIRNLQLTTISNIFNYSQSFSENKRSKEGNNTVINTYSLTTFYPNYFYLNDNCEWWKFPVIIKPSKDSLHKGKLESLKLKYPNGFIIAEKISFVEWIKNKAYRNDNSKKEFFQHGRKDIHLLANYFDLESFRNIEKLKLPKVQREVNLDKSKKVFSGFKFNDGFLKSARIHKKDISKNYTNIIIEFDSLDEKLKGNLTAEDIFNSNNSFLYNLFRLDSSKNYTFVFLTRSEVKSFTEMFPNSILFEDYLKQFLTKDVINKFIIHHLTKLLELNFKKLNYDKLNGYDYNSFNTTNLILSVYEKFKSELPNHKVLNKVLRLLDKNNLDSDLKMNNFSNSNLLYYITGRKIFTKVEKKNLLQDYNKRFALLKYIPNHRLDDIVSKDLESLTEYIKTGLGEIK